MVQGVGRGSTSCSPSLWAFPKERLKSQVTLIWKRFTNFGPPVLHFTAHPVAESLNSYKRGCAGPGILSMDRTKSHWAIEASSLSPTTPPCFSQWRRHAGTRHPAQ